MPAISSVASFTMALCVYTIGCRWLGCCHTTLTYNCAFAYKHGTAQCVDFVHACVYSHGYWVVSLETYHMGWGGVGCSYPPSKNASLLPSRLCSASQAALKSCKMSSFFVVSHFQSLQSSSARRSHGTICLSGHGIPEQ